MKRLVGIILIFFTIVLTGCEERTGQTDSGGALLSVSSFDGLPDVVSVNSSLVPVGALSISEVDIENIAKDPDGRTSNLMNVEIQSYEVTFSRADAGDLLPPPHVERIFGVVPVNGSLKYENMTVLSLDQILSRPLSDLQLSNGGFDRETGQQFQRHNFHIRFFGRTLSGDAVQSAPFSFTVTFER